MKYTSTAEPALDLKDLTDEELADIPCEEVLTSSSRRRRQFLRGPIDWQDVCAVAKLPGKTWAVWLLLHLRWPMEDGEGVTLPNSRLAEMGVDRWAKIRALRALEDAGFIRVERRRGCSARITLVTNASDGSKREGKEVPRG
jgi:hypothetical protein